MVLKGIASNAIFATSNAIFATKKKSILIFVSLYSNLKRFSPAEQSDLQFRIKYKEKEFKRKN